MNSSASPIAKTGSLLPAHKADEFRIYDLTVITHDVAETVDSSGRMRT
jgi:hypothetical protein